MDEASPRQASVDPALAAMGRSLNEAIRVLGDRQGSGDETDGVNRRYIPGPLQSSGQTVSGILELVQTLIHGDDAEEGEEGDSAPAGLVSGGGDGAHVALLGHSLAAYMSVLPRERLRRLTTRILSDTMLWFCRLFRFENGSAYYHGDEHDGLLRVCRLALHSRYDDYATDGFQALTRQPPVVYVSAAASPGTAQHLCRQLGLPLSCLCTVPCNTVFGSQHQMDVASLERLVKDDISSGKLPLLLVANAGTPVAGHTDKLGRLRELCDQHGLWLHAQGVNLATLVLGYVSSSVLAAVKCDSLTLTPGPWLGLPACPAVTLYRHDDPALSLAAGLASCQPVEKLRALPLWLSLQRLGHDGVVQRVRHASSLSQRLIEKLKLVPGVRTLVEDELSSPVVLFKYAGDSWQPASERDPAGDVNQDVMDAFNRWLGEELARAAPVCAVDAVELADVGVCLRFSPLSCAAGLGTAVEHVDALIEALGGAVPVMAATLRLRHVFRREALAQPNLSYLEEPGWAGLGAVRFELTMGDVDPARRGADTERVNAEALRKLVELDSDVPFRGGGQAGVYVGMVADDVDVRALVETIADTAREVEESTKLLENMADMVQKGIHEAEEQLRKASQDKLMQEGVLRQLPVVGSMLNWLSPLHASMRGQAFNLMAGALESTESTYSSKMQTQHATPPVTPTSERHSHLSAQKLFRHSSHTSEAGQQSESNSDVVEEAPSQTERPSGSPGSPGSPTEVGAVTQRDEGGDDAEDPGSSPVTGSSARTTPSELSGTGKSGTGGSVGATSSGGGTSSGGTSSGASGPSAGSESSSVVGITESESGPSRSHSQDPATGLSSELESEGEKGQ